MSFDGNWPEWIMAHVVSDDVFGNAYNAVPDDKRAWCKTTIAQLHTMHGSPGMQWGRADKEWRQGFVSMQESRPADWTVVLLGNNYASAPRLLAAIMIPLLAGVENLAVVRTGNTETKWAESVLAGLELAGVESVFAMPVPEAERFIDELSRLGEGRVLLLGNVECELTTDVSCWCEPLTQSLVLADPLPKLNQEIVAWAHPDCELQIISAEMLESQAHGANAVYCSADATDLVPDCVPLMLSPGQEGCWVWPDLSLEMFFIRRIALLRD